MRILNVAFEIRAASFFTASRFSFPVTLMTGFEPTECPPADLAVVAPSTARLAIIDAVQSAVTAEFGNPHSFTTKVVRWSLAIDRLDVALLKANCGTVVLPFDQQADERPYFGEILKARFDAEGRCVRKGRSTNLAHAEHKSLGWDRDLIYLRPLTRWELSRQIELIGEKLNGVPIRDAVPPDDDVALADIGFSGSRQFGSGFLSKARAVFHRDNGRCRVCGKSEKLHVDHIIPRAKGGSDSMDNLWLLCDQCNLSKTDTF
jgi:hypothetical protein